MQNISLSLYEEKDLKKIEKIGLALASKIRLNILKDLEKEPKTLTELYQKYLISFSSIVHHIKILEDAGLVKTIHTHQQKGSSQLVIRDLLNINIDINNDIQESNFDNQLFKISMPVGCYTLAEFGEKNGFVNKDSGTTYSYTNNPYSTERFNAGIIYANKGFVEYDFDNSEIKEQQIVEISISLEICSETTFYNNNFPSLLGFSINGIEVCEHLSPGDFGGRKGIYTPAIVGPNSSQYGQLIKISINDAGTYLNGLKLNSNITIDKLRINQSNSIKFRITSKEYNKSFGGFNLFGKGFGDYDQNIELTLVAKIK